MQNAKLDRVGVFSYANLTVSVMPPASGAFASTSYHDDSHLNLMGRRAPQSALSVSIPTFTRAPQSSFNVSQSFNISETSSISGKLIDRVRPSSAAVIIPTAKLNRPMLEGGDAVVATYLPATRQGSGALVVGTIVAGLPLSASLPKMSAVKADLVPLGVGSPSIPKRRHPDEEIAMLRKRLRLLEAELKKCIAALHRESERADHGTTREDLERQVAVWDRAKEQWQQEHEAELQRVRDEYESRLDATSREWDKRLRSSTSDVNATAEARLAALKEDIENKAREKAERDKEERIKVLKQKSARRLLNAGLANGWSAWLQLWGAKTNAITRLREVANRLRKPEMSLAFFYLNRHRESARRMELARAAFKKEETLLSVRTELEDEIARLHAEMERKLALAEESKQRALELLRIELLGTTTQQVEALAAKEKEERIALLRRQSARRLLNAGLAHGWAAWIEVRLTGDTL